MKVDVRILTDLVNDGWLRVAKHPDADLFIWNYTEACQFEKHWTPETMMCRGLITDLEGNVMSRPFPKFFNLGEIEGDLPNEPFQVWDKIDGSLGIIYWIGDKAQVATRGSFVSEQAVNGTEILYNKYARVIPSLDRTKTYLFEILYPANRIVVDYGGAEDLIHLATIDTETGAEEEELKNVGFPQPKRFYVKSIEELREKPGELP